MTQFKTSQHPATDRNSATAAWQVSAEEFPTTGTSEEKLEFMLRYAVLAPSSHNSQPWLFRVQGNEVELYADRTRNLRILDPEDRELIISCGAALFHLRLAMQHFGYLGTIEILPDPGDPDLLARVRLGYQGEKSVQENLLFRAILKRRTNRQAFKEDPVPDALLSQLQLAAAEEGASLFFIAGEEARCAVADLISEADRIQWANKRFRLELAAWVHANSSGRRDGIPGYAQGMGDLISSAGPMVIRTFDLGEGQAAKDRDIAVYSPVLALLQTQGDSLSDWVAAGQALARVLLRARVEDVYSSFLNQPIEVPEMRVRLKKILQQEKTPQLLMRFGFADEVKPTPRRSVEECLI